MWYGQCDILVHKSVVSVAADAMADTSLDDADEDMDPYYDSSCANVVEVKTHSQAIAQAIVNAFLESKHDPDLFDKFIPSFLATESTVQIILYNCSLDKLLCSDELMIWEESTKPNTEPKLNIQTMIFVWAAFNCYVKENQHDVEHIIQQTPISGFKELMVKENAYEIYVNHLTRPYKFSKADKGITLNDTNIDSVKLRQRAYIYKACERLVAAKFCEELR